MSHFTGLQLKALHALLEQTTVRRASVACQCSERQLFRYLEQPGFKAELRRLEGQVLDDSVRRLTVLSSQAVDALEEVMSCPSQEGAGIRLRAAGAILDNVLRLRELLDLEERVSKLEEQVQHDNKK